MIGDDLVFVVPVWKRTRNIERVYGAVRATTPGARVLFVASADDPDVLAELERVALLTDRNALVVDWPGGSHGDYARKINAGYRASIEPFVFTGADDVVPHEGWYEAARALISETAEPRVESSETAPAGALVPSIGVVGTVDDCNGRTIHGVHSTHSLVARWYADCCAVVDTPGAIYCELYSHEWCDDELVRSAISRGAYVHAFDATVEHVHMLKDRTLDDETYRHGRAQPKANRRIFMRRRHLWGEGTPPSAVRNHRRPRGAVRRV